MGELRQVTAQVEIDITDPQDTDNHIIRLVTTFEKLLLSQISTLSSVRKELSRLKTMEEINLQMSAKKHE